ncbi:hypothetical protein [Pseudarcicella hirudinis]|nr:hypothetical protein [Pseudarcicella hirudinis]
MTNLKKAVITILMIIVWWQTAFFTMITSSWRGKLVAIIVGLGINITLAVYYSCLEKKPGSFKNWLKM